MLDLQFEQSALTDIEFLDSVNTICMRDHVEKLMSWRPDLFRQSFDPALVKIIVHDGTKIGMLKLVHENHELYLADVMVLPEYQNRGIGTAVILYSIEQARLANLPIRLKVLRSNPAKHLYERLGFKTVDHDEHYFIMRNAV